jgi:hypothetical protein
MLRVHNQSKPHVLGVFDRVLPLFEQERIQGTAINIREVPLCPRLLLHLAIVARTGIRAFGERQVSQ